MPGEERSPTTRGRSRLAGWCVRGSRAAFALAFWLAMMTPAWDAGAFSWWPLATFRLSGQRFQVGALGLLPAMAFLLWVGTRLLDGRRWGWRWGPAHVTLPLMLLSGWTLLRCWPVHNRHILAIVVIAVGVYVGTYGYLLQQDGPRWCVLLIAVLMALQGGIAAAQFARQGSVGLSWMGEGALDPAGQGISVIEAGGRRWLRAYGLTAHPNVLGGYLAMSILICLGALRSVKRGGRPFMWAAIVLGALGLFCSFSRSAWLGMAAGLAFLGATTRPWQGLDWRSPRVRRALAIAGVLLAACGLALAMLYGELLRARLLRLGSPLEATSIEERVVDYAQAWGLIRDVPLKGVGSGYYILALWAGVGEDRPPGFRKVHNAYLLATAELGVVGALAWTSTLLVAPLAVARRAWRRDRRGVLPARPEAGWAAAFCCALVLCLFDSYLYVPSTWWAALFMGLVAAGYALAAGRERGGEAD